jgi:ferredoxin
MGRPFWQIRILTLFWPLRNLLARMVGWPVTGRWLRSVFRDDRASYIPVQTEIQRPESTPLPSVFVEQLIEKSSFRFILHRCLCRTLEACRHFPPEIGCLFLGEGAKEIDPGLGRAATVEEALTHHRRARSLGLIPMVGKVGWDSIWLGVGRRKSLLTICHCCDCCCYFRLYRFLPAEVAGTLKKLEGLEIHIEESCDGCGICAERCFMQAITLQDGKAVIGDRCRGCGRCALVCPRQAIRLSLPGLEGLQAWAVPPFCGRKR